MAQTNPYQTYKQRSETASRICQKGFDLYGNMTPELMSQLNGFLDCIVKNLGDLDADLGGITEMNTSRLLGRTSTGVGAVEEISVGSGLSLSGKVLSSTSSLGATMQVANLTLSNDDIKSLNSVPVQLLAAEAGSMYLVMTPFFIHRTIATGYSSSPTFRMTYDNGGVITTTGGIITTSTSETLTRVTPSAASINYASTGDPASQGIYVDSTANVTGGSASNSLVLRVPYVKVTNF